MRDKFKDIIVGTTEYRIGLVPADVGNWIVLQMTGGKASDFDTFKKIQTFLLERCSVYRGGDGARVPVKVYEAGRWLVPDLDLEYDLNALNSIITEALTFNFDPFFERLKKEEAAAETSTSNQSHSQTT